MMRFEVPYNLDPEFPERLSRRQDLIPYIDSIYAAAWKEDCDNTRYDITFRDDYSKSYEEYESRLKDLLSLGIPVSILAQRGAKISMIRKYRSLGVHSFILNDDKLAVKIREAFPEVKLTLSVTRVLTLQDLQEGRFDMYDRIVLFHWFSRHLDSLALLPERYKYVMICNSGCYYDCKWHDAHWFIKSDDIEKYREESAQACRSCNAILMEGRQKSSVIEPEDLPYFDPYVDCYKLVDRYDSTDAIIGHLYEYANGKGRYGRRPREYYNL
jgi:hypothetical protein